MSTPPRFHQSYAKTLLNDCPAMLRLQLTQERKQSRAMEAGSLLDYLVFGQDEKYEIVDARYKSGPRAGEECTDWLGKEAQTARDEARARGVLPVLASEVDALTVPADAIKGRISKLAVEMAGGKGAHDCDVHYQPTIQWTSELGVECEGTPDVIVCVLMRDLIKVCVVDVKHTAFLPAKRFNSQVYAMGWDIQGAAYREGAVKWAESEYTTHAFAMDHVILATSSIELGLPPCARRLSSTYLEVGKRRWEKGQRLWQRCLDTDDWPGYSEDDADPSYYIVRAEIETDDGTPAFEATDEEP